jgi:hypothetical protein
VEGHRVASALQRAIRHPRWFAENFRGRLRRQAARRGGIDHVAQGHSLEPAELVVADLAGVPLAEVRAARNEVEPLLFGNDLGDLAARRVLREAIATTIRLTKPEVVVETGVARGASSAIALSVMELNGVGHLHSIDLPPLGIDEKDIGELVPTTLRGRWTLLLGPSSVHLPALLRELDQVDIFVHDSDHTYQGQLREFRAVWPHLRGGGLILCDDVATSAFVDFADEVAGRARLIETPGHPEPIGILQRT